MLQHISKKNHNSVEQKESSNKINIKNDKKNLKKDRYVNSQIQKKNYDDASTWTCEHCTMCLKECKENAQSDKSKLHVRRML